MVLRPLLLDAFCGAGGASVGYHRAGFEVVGVDHVAQPNFPFRFIQADALEYLAEHGHEYACIAASPPCQRYSAFSVMPTAGAYPDLLGATLELVRATGLPFVVENVPGAPWPADLYRVLLCGSMFGLRFRRHRWFATNVAMLVPTCSHGRSDELVGIYGASDGAHPVGFKHPGNRRGPRQATTAEARELMGMPWAAKRREVTEAIPPVFTELIGGFLLAAALARQAAA